jgi:hypothetical protein
MAMESDVSRLFTVQSWEVAQWWPHVIHHIERWAEQDGVWSTEGIKLELMQGRAQLWCFHHDQIMGIWVTRIHETDNTKIGVVWGCAGDFKAFEAAALSSFEVIEGWMKSQGCDLIEIVGRAGWGRVFRDYEQHAVILRKQL